MSQTNPEIEAQLEKLAELCCELLKAENHEFGERVDGLLKALLMSGYVWKKDQPLMVEVESRVKARCGDTAMHRGGALSTLTSELERKFKSLAQWESRSPDDRSPPKAANISAATDA